ncbi:MAG: FkbM family methyltransferase [Betaproteobacteria bacterium]|nr:FkbM family methyltransferase [Betaproteobacteria bacterium]
MLADEIAAWEKKIREIGGTVNSERISVDGIVLNNCYLQFPLVVVENIYHQNYGLSLDRESIVVDIGANAGVSALFLAQNSAVTKVIGFEPLVPIFRMLQDNLSLNRELAKKIEVFNFGLGERSEKLTVRYSRDHAMSASMRGIYDRYYQSVDSNEQIEIFDAAAVIDDIFSKHPDQQIVLKMDCEGAEFEILPRLAEKGLLGRVGVLIVEFHDKQPSDLIDLLHRSGFTSFVEWNRRDINIGMIRSVRRTSSVDALDSGIAS